MHCSINNHYRHLVRRLWWLWFIWQSKLGWSLRVFRSICNENNSQQYAAKMKFMLQRCILHFSCSCEPWPAWYQVRSYEMHFDVTPCWRASRDTVRIANSCIYPRQVQVFAHFLSLRSHCWVYLIKRLHINWQCIQLTQGVGSTGQLTKSMLQPSSE